MSNNTETAKQLTYTGGGAPGKVFVIQDTASGKYLTYDRGFDLTGKVTAWSCLAFVDNSAADEIRDDAMWAVDDNLNVSAGALRSVEGLDLKVVEIDTPDGYGVCVTCQKFRPENYFYTESSCGDCAESNHP